MIVRLVRLALLLAALDIAAGVVIDARMVARPWASCVALAQRPATGAVSACGAAVESIYRVDLPAASWAVVREARQIWFNSRHGINTI